MKQTQKILKIMESDPTRWWLPYDFMSPDLGDLFVGYKAGTRLAEMAQRNPNLFESKKVGKYVARRLHRPDIKPEEPKATQENIGLQIDDMRGYR